MHVINNLLKGIIIGIGGIIPGLSGAVIAILFGLYDDMIYAIAHFFKDIKKNFVFLLPILCGIGIGFILFSNIQKYVLEHHPFETMLIIIGLIIGTVPALVKAANIKKFQLSYIILFLATLTIGLLLAYLSEMDINVSNTKMDMNINNILSLIFIGFIMAGTHIIPGISGTVILILLGTYGIMLNAIANLKNIFFLIVHPENSSMVIYNIIVVIPIGIGLLIGAIVFSKLMNYLLKRYYTQTYIAIIGFVIGSIPCIVPPMDFTAKTFIALLLLFISITLSYKISMVE